MYSILVKQVMRIKNLELSHNIQASSVKAKYQSQGL